MVFDIVLNVKEHQYVSVLRKPKLTSSTPKMLAYCAGSQSLTLVKANKSATSIRAHPMSGIWMLISNLTEIVYMNTLFAFIMLIMLSPFIIFFLSGDHPAGPSGNCYAPPDGCQWCCCGHRKLVSEQELLNRLSPTLSIYEVARKAKRSHYWQYY